MDEMTKFKAETDDGKVLGTWTGSGADQKAVDKADAYNARQAPGTPFAYAYGWDAVNNEWQVVS